MDEERTGSAGSLDGRAKPGRWPELTLGGWPDTRVTLHMWTQVVGKIRLALEPAVNHWWQVPLYLSARGMTTSIMHAKDRGLEIEFDFIDHVLALQTTSGKRRTVALEPRTVASFYEETMSRARRSRCARRDHGATGRSRARHSVRSGHRARLI
jgi:Family of unknown function (DUF5996)